MLPKTYCYSLKFYHFFHFLDTVVLRYVSSSLVIEDRYTENHDYRPEEDLGNGGYKNYVLISGSRVTTAWDATFTRKVNTNDPVFDTIIT